MEGKRYPENWQELVEVEIERLDRMAHNRDALTYIEGYKRLAQELSGIACRLEVAIGGRGK